MFKNKTTGRDQRIFFSEVLEQMSRATGVEHGRQIGAPSYTYTLCKHIHTNITVVDHCFRTESSCILLMYPILKAIKETIFSKEIPTKRCGVFSRMMEMSNPPAIQQLIWFAAPICFCGNWRKWGKFHLEQKIHQLLRQRCRNWDC